MTFYQTKNDSNFNLDENISVLKLSCNKSPTMGNTGSTIDHCHRWFGLDRALYYLGTREAMTWRVAMVKITHKSCNVTLGIKKYFCVFKPLTNLTTMFGDFFSTQRRAPLICDTMSAWAENMSVGNVPVGKQSHSTDAQRFSPHTVLRIEKKKKSFQNTIY